MTTEIAWIAVGLAVLALCWLYRTIRHSILMDCAMADWHRFKGLGWQELAILHLLGKRYGRRVQWEVIERASK